MTAVVAIAFGLIGRVPWLVWLPSAASAVLIAAVARSGALRAAIAFGDLVRTAFDIHRRSLLSAMGLRLPETLEDERALWKALGQQLYRRGAEEGELLRFEVGQSAGLQPDKKSESPRKEEHTHDDSELGPLGGNDGNEPTDPMAEGEVEQKF
jgi:hypothetical protein